MNHVIWDTSDPPKNQARNAGLYVRPLTNRRDVAHAPKGIPPGDTMNLWSE